ncbi:hypothetical protein DY000_02060841 [Brassica cretica]|uniref:Uncharacterized protein n=1 Tax=Brassica cretica TaxID=69181 RepID=A0ABQ7B4B1_BRACR|nr:hypothetical protein DY000_02060841 [Brassica cretica]
MADIKGKCILYEDKDEPIHLVDQNDSHTMREYHIKGKCILYEDEDEPIHLVDQNDSHTMREYQNGQVIGALQGMEIGDSTTTMVDQEKETRVESDVQGDDLLGEDLEAMEEGMSKSWNPIRGSKQKGRVPSSGISKETSF